MKGLLDINPKPTLKSYQMEEYNARNDMVHAILYCEVVTKPGLSHQMPNPVTSPL